jgi:aryl-alcohol dehydrogenase-like predicted oxidoreductase
MRKIGADLGASVAQVAVAWLLAKASVDSVILGATKVHQLEDNLGAADLVLDPSLVAELDSLTPLPPMYPNWYWDQLGDHTRAAALSGAPTAPAV